MMLAQIGLTQGAYQLFGISDEQVLLRTGIYAVVMVVLFIASYTLQQQWVFTKKPKSNTEDSNHD